MTFLLNSSLGLEDGARELALASAQGAVPVQLILSLASAMVLSRELSRPFRTTTHRLAVAAVIGATVLPVASPYSVRSRPIRARRQASEPNHRGGSPGARRPHVSGPDPSPVDCCVDARAHVILYERIE
jgi:hypothetical protein